MSGTIEQLKAFEASKDYFVGIDSDGCVFDTMEIKHKECFCPQFVKHFQLQSVSRYAREAWEFVNLYSKTRGANRFKALVRALDLLAERTDVQVRGAKVPVLQGVREWMTKETRLGDPALAAALEENPQADLEQTLNWSRDVNAVVKDMVHHVPPFPYVRESLQKLAEVADLMVVSQTPTEALEREWCEHHIDGLVRFIAGQELGTKAEHLTYATAKRYAPDHVLLIGDAPGDFEAARANGVLFYPVIPGSEDASWSRFHDEAMQKFISGEYAGDYQNSLVEEFDRHLPEKAPWQSCSQ